MSNDPRQAKLNVKDHMSPAMKMNLPCAPGFDPSDKNGWRAPPSQTVRNLLPKGQELRKNFNLSSEFMPTVANSIPPFQRMRWRYNHNWAGRFPGVFQDKNIVFKNNCLQLKATRVFQPPDEMFGSFSSYMIDKRRKDKKPFYGNSFLRTKDTMTYGYTEIGCRLSDSAVTSAFWLKELGGTQREIDVFEYTTGRQKGEPQHTREHLHLMTIHQFKSRVTGKHEHLNTYVKFDKDLSKERFFKAGLLWTKHKIYWLVNDVVVRELDHRGLFGKDCKMHVQVDREIFDWIFDPDGNDKLEDFVVYYIRTWDL